MYYVIRIQKIFTPIIARIRERRICDNYRVPATPFVTPEESFDETDTTKNMESRLTYEELRK